MTEPLHGGPIELVPRAPHFRNRCDECVFLGHFDGFDLWLHRMGGAPSLRVQFRDSPYGFASCTIASAAEARLSDYVLEGADPDVMDRVHHALRLAYLICIDEDHIL